MTIKFAALDPLAILSAEPVFSVLAPDVARNLASLARVEVYPAASLLAERGSRPDLLWYIAEGSVELGLFSQGGRSAILGPILPGGWATWLACFHQAPLPHDLWTGPDTRLVAFPAAEVRRAAEDNGRVYAAVVARIGDRMRSLIGWHLASGLGSPERRLAWLLASLAQSASRQTDGTVDLRLSHEHLAATGFGSRQRVARLLGRLEAEGLIQRGYGTVRIPDWKALETYAEV